MMSPAQFQQPGQMVFAPQMMPQVQPAQWAQHPAPMYRPPANQMPAPSPRIAAAAPQQGAQPKLTARGAMPDEAPARPRIQLPAPESFGLKALDSAPTPMASSQLAAQTIPVSTVNWNLVREELHRLGAKSFNVEQLQDGRHRFACQVTKTTGHTTLVEVIGQTEEEAVRSGLDKASAFRYGS